MQIWGREGKKTGQPGWCGGFLKGEVPVAHLVREGYRGNPTSMKIYIHNLWTDGQLVITIQHALYTQSLSNCYNNSITQGKTFK